MTTTITAQSRWDDHDIKSRYRVHRMRGLHHEIVRASGLLETTLDAIVDSPEQMSDEHIALLKPLVPSW